LVAVRYPTKNPPLRLRGLAVDLENPRRPGSGVRASPATGLVGQRRRSSVPIADRTDPGCGRTPPDDHPRLCNTFLGPTMSAVRLMRRLCNRPWRREGQYDDPIAWLSSGPECLEEQ
jgi:hypothetical protein